MKTPAGTMSSDRNSGHRPGHSERYLRTTMSKLSTHGDELVVRDDTDNFDRSCGTGVNDRAGVNYGG